MALWESCKTQTNSEQKNEHLDEHQDLSNILEMNVSRVELFSHHYHLHKGGLFSVWFAFCLIVYQEHFMKGEEWAKREP